MFTGSHNNKAEVSVMARDVARIFVQGIALPLPSFVSLLFLPSLIPSGASLLRLKATPLIQLEGLGSVRKRLQRARGRQTISGEFIA